MNFVSSNFTHTTATSARKYVNYTSTFVGWYFQGTVKYTFKTLNVKPWNKITFSLYILKKIWNFDFDLRQPIVLFRNSIHKVDKSLNWTKFYFLK
jgi:hypothetical protein